MIRQSKINLTNVVSHSCQFVSFTFLMSLGPKMECFKVSVIAHWDVPCCPRVLRAGSEMELGKDVPL